MALVIAQKTFQSRLLVGTGKFSSPTLMGQALESSGTEIVTVALRRIDLNKPHDPNTDILNYIDRRRYQLLPNTSGARTAKEAITLAHLAREAGLSDMVKLEVIGDQQTLLPDVADADKIKDNLIHRPEIIGLFKMSGNYDMLALVLAKNPTDLELIISELLKQPEVKNVHGNLSIHTYKFSQNPGAIRIE